MRPMTILIALCLVGMSLQTVEFYGDKPTLMKRLACVNIALKTYLNDYRNIWIFSSNSNIPVNSLLKVPLFVITDWDVLREGLFIDRGPVILFLEGNADQDFGSLKRVQGLLTVEPLLMVCITNMICSSEIYLKKIGEMAAGTELRYVAVDERGIIDIYEHTSMAEGSCGMAQLSRLGHCSDKPTAEKVFGTSMNFHKCPIRVVTWPCPPYSYIYNFNESKQLYGIAGSVVNIVTHRVNATPVLLTVHSPKDVRRHVANRDADLGYGELDIRPFEGISYSKPYIFVQATVVAPHSTWTLTRAFGNILQPLGDEVWLAIGVVILVIVILRRLVPYFRRILVLQLFGTFFGIPVPRQPRRDPSRIYFLSLVLFGYFCSQSYLTNLTKALATPSHRMIKTFYDLEHSNLRVTGPPDARIMFKDHYPRIYRDFQVDDDADYYFNLFRLLQGRFNSVYYVEDFDKNIAEWKNVEAINDRFNWFAIALVAPNTSIVLETSNDILMRIWETGVLNAHKSFILPTYQSPKSLSPISSGKSTELGFNELKGVFLLLIAGLAMSFFVFMIEIVTAFIRKYPKSEGKRISRPGWSRQRIVHGILPISKHTYRTRLDID